MDELSYRGRVAYISVGEFTMYYNGKWVVVELIKIHGRIEIEFKHFLQHYKK